MEAPDVFSDRQRTIGTAAAARERNDVRNLSNAIPSQMKLSEKQEQELSLLMRGTGIEITEKYYDQFCQVLENLGLFFEFAGTCAVPIEVWIGIVQALADASGYSVALEAAILEPIKSRSGQSLIVGRREVATVEPTLFVKET